MLSVWEERKVRLYGKQANIHQSHSQNDSGGMRGVAGGDGELGCLCGLGRVLFLLSYQGSSAGRALSLQHNTTKGKGEPQITLCMVTETITSAHAHR